MRRRRLEPSAYVLVYIRRSGLKDYILPSSDWEQPPREWEEGAPHGCKGSDRGEGRQAEQEACTHLLRERA